ncbi:MAG: hypothetical protein A2Y17_05940 [Clostridiales bacterium GWF2_38_85]|nr:MAG: hypothetical protein A2Y17_05940 [Clostridiales bacterium GWF2_38_85]HBL84573.1 hypothetical protein [Clostridiales bacterium]
MNRVKGILFIILISGLFYSCVSNSDYEDLCTAVDNTNKYFVYEESFYLSISSNTEDTTVMFAQGDLNIDKSNKLIMNGVMTQYVLGTSSTVKVAYSDGKYYSDITGEDIKSYTDLDEAGLLEQFIFSEAPVFEKNELKSLKTSTGGTTKTYEFKLKANNELFKKLLGENIYTLAGALNPDYNKTNYGDADCVFVVDISGKNPILSSISLTYDITVYNKMPYIPNVKFDDADYRFDISATMRLSYKEFGEGVTVTLPDDLDEYIPDNEIANDTSEDDTLEVNDESTSENSLETSDNNSTIESEISES